MGWLELVEMPSISILNRSDCKYLVWCVLLKLQIVKSKTKRRKSCQVFEETDDCRIIQD